VDEQRSRETRKQANRENGTERKKVSRDGKGTTKDWNFGKSKNKMIKASNSTEHSTV
jgi:hypothetical protein